MVGESYEKMAGKYLEKQGYQILRYNFRCRTGEIDIIAQKAETIIFCEVKYRRNNSKGHPFEAITTNKQRTIANCALYYLSVEKIRDMNVRFDVIGILGTKIEWLQNAFDFQLNTGR